MMSRMSQEANLSPVGWILRQCREGRGLSQFDLAAQGGVSARHLSCVETGRAEPSRELLMRLSSSLCMSARDRNALLSAAGYLPIHRETRWEDAQGTELAKAVRLLLRQAEPFAAAAVDRDHQVVMVNKAMALFVGMLLGQQVPAYTLLPQPRLDLLRLTFDPTLGMREAIVNWEEVARWVLHNARAEMAGGRDRRAMERFSALLELPGVAALLDDTKPPPQMVLLPMQVRVGDQVASLFSTITTLGSALDVTASELRIETWHPADDVTEALIRSLAGG